MTRTAVHIINKLLGRQGRVRVAAATGVLSIGMSLLLLSILAWWNFSLLAAGEKQQLRSSVLVVAKTITERNMGADNTFTASETDELRTAPSVTDIAPITPALFPAYATLGGTVGLSTDLPLESVADRFLDTIPPGWGWQPGQRDVPLLVSSQFFDIYNYVFAPGQGLPQLSHTSATMLTLKLQVGGRTGDAYIAHVAGFTSRFGSILAPESFVAYGNRAFAPEGAARPSQVALVVADPADARLNHFLEQKGYTTNPQNLRWSRLRGVVNAVTAGSGLVALLLVGISGLVFSLFIQLTLARTRESLTLLGQLGYTAGFLRRAVHRRLLPMTLASVASALILSIIIQVLLANMTAKIGLSLPQLPGWPVWAASIAAALLLSAWLVMTTRKAIKA